MKNLKLNSLIIRPINLQLFAANDGDDSDNLLGVVDQDDEIYEDDDSYDDSEFGDNDEGEDDSEDGEDEDKQEKPDVAGPDKSKQSKEENEQFKKMRQQAKADALKELEAERTKLDADKKEMEAFRQQQRNSQIEQKYFSEITQELVEDFAYKEGIPEEFARKHLIQEAKNKAIQEINAVNSRIGQAQYQKAELKDKPYFKELEKDIDDLISKEPNLDVKTAYNYLRGVKLDELLANEKKNAEKRTIANIQDKARRRSVPSSGSDAGLDVGKVLSKDDIEMAIAFGNDPRKIAKKVKENLRDKKRR